MSMQYFGFYFSANADGSSNSHTIHVNMDAGGDKVILGARYRSSEENGLYEIALDANDLETFGKMCIEFSKIMRKSEAEE